MSCAATSVAGAATMRFPPAASMPSSEVAAAASRLSPPCGVRAWPWSTAWLRSSNSLPGERRAEGPATAPGCRSGGIRVVSSEARRELHPGMLAALVDRVLGRRKARVGKRAHRHAYLRLPAAFFRVKHGAPANRTEAEAEPAAVIAGAD